jgi:hypothetical protein
MRVVVHGVLKSVGELADRIGPNDITIGKVQVRWLGRVFDAECEGEGNLMFYGPTRHSAERNTPLLNRLHCGGYEQWIAGNGLQFDNRTIISKNQMELNHSFNVGEPCFLWVIRLHEMHGVATQVLLLLWNAQRFGGSRRWSRVLRRWLRDKN